MNYNIIKKTNDWLFCPWGPKRDMRNLAMIPLIGIWYWYILKPSVSHQNPLFLEWKTSLLAEFFSPHFYYTHGTEFEMNKFMRLLCFIETCPQFYRLVIFLPWQYNAESAQGNVHRLVILRFSLKTSVKCYAKMGYYKYLNGFFSSNK